MQSRIEKFEEDDRKAAEALDQISLIGGPAAILASITFLKDIAPDPAPGTRFFLLAAWALLLTGAASSLLAHATTRATARRLRRIYEAAYASGSSKISLDSYAEPRRWNAWTRVLSIGGVALFLAGTIFLVIFAAANLPPERAGGTTSPGAEPQVQVKPR
jgi:hypothetical protein